MKRTVIIISALFLSAGCGRSAADITETAAAETPAASAESSAVNGTAVTENPYSFLPEDEDAVYVLSDSLSLHLKGEVRSVPYAQTDQCIVYDKVILKGASGQNLTLFETMPVLINSEYGNCILRKIDDLYLFSFDPAAQFGGVYAVIFDGSGTILKEFEMAEIRMNTEDDTQFTAVYTCGSRGMTCEYSLQQESDKYDITGSEISVAPDYYEDLEQLREKASQAGAAAAMAAVSSVSGTAQESYEGTVYTELYHFMGAVDAYHTVSDGGDMLFCAVPADPDASVAVNDISNPADPKVLYRSESGDPLFLITSLYDSSLELTVVSNDGRTSSFSLKDYGSDPAFTDGTVYDFTYDDRLSPTECERQLLEEYPELADYAGDPSNFTESIVLDGKLCYIAYYGTVQPGGHFTRERTFAVASDQSRIYEYDTAGDIWYHTVY